MPDGEQITPKNNFFLLGQEEAEKALLGAYNSNKLHNSWLISGVKGIGKATLAYRFARFLLDERRRSFSPASSLATDPDSPANRLVSSGSHPDFKVIERDFIETDRKKVLKAIKDGAALDESELKGLKKSAFIRIDDVRGINEFLAKKSSGDGWRAVIIDSIDDMNPASANALLKILEEPPAKSILLLISHNVGQLLPTIRSRCTKLVLKPLSDNAVASLLRRYRPELDETAVKGITEIASGSIGKALNYADCGALERYRGLSAIIGAGSRFRLQDLLDWVDAAVGSEESFELASELVLKYCYDHILFSRDIEETARAWENAVRVLRQTDSLNMDKKEALINIIGNLCKVM